MFFTSGRGDTSNLIRQERSSGRGFDLGETSLVATIGMTGIYAGINLVALRGARSRASRSLSCFSARETSPGFRFRHPERQIKVQPIDTPSFFGVFR